MGKASAKVQPRAHAAERYLRDTGCEKRLERSTSHKNPKPKQNQNCHCHTKHTVEVRSLAYPVPGIRELVGRSLSLSLSLFRPEHVVLPTAAVVSDCALPLALPTVPRHEGLSSSESRTDRQTDRLEPRAITCYAPLREIVRSTSGGRYTGVRASVPTVLQKRRSFHYYGDALELSRANSARRASPYSRGDVADLHSGGSRRARRGEARRSVARWGEARWTARVDTTEIIRSANDTRRNAATRGTAMRDDAFPATATEKLSEHRGRESVSPHHAGRATAAPPTTGQRALGRPRLRSSCGRTGFKPAALSSRRPAVSPRPAADFKAAKISPSPFLSRDALPRHIVVRRLV